MIRNLMRLLALCLALGALFPSNLVWGANEFRVVASIKPVHSILAGLMQGLEPPELLVSGRHTPFDYKLDGPQASRLGSAQMLVWVGPELEKFLIDPVANLGDGTHIVTILDSPNLKILPSRWDPSLRDPFFWLDSRNGLILVDELTRALVSADPARSHLYKRNRDKVFERISQLDRALEYGYRGLKRGQALGYYDTQQYFEQAYALKIGDFLTASPLLPVSAASLLGAHNKLSQGKYACLLVEQPLEMSNFDLLMGDAGIPVAQLDSLGADLDAGTDLYFELMERNTRAIKRCFLRNDQVANHTPDVAEVPKSEQLGGRFMLIDHDGELFTDKDMQGKYQLIFFGYISCPDVCPISLMTGARALELLAGKAGKIQPYFITVDPERDTPDVVKNYVRFFSKEIIGLTGTGAMIERVARHYNVKFEKVINSGGEPNSYTVDHTASFFLMAPNGEFITKFAYGISAKKLAEKLKEHLR